MTHVATPTPRAVLCPGTAVTIGHIALGVMKLCNSTYCWALGGGVSISLPPSTSWRPFFSLGRKLMVLYILLCILKANGINTGRWKAIQDIAREWRVFCSCRGWGHEIVGEGSHSVHSSCGVKNSSWVFNLLLQLLHFVLHLLSFHHHLHSLFVRVQTPPLLQPPPSRNNRRVPPQHLIQWPPPNHLVRVNPELLPRRWLLRGIRTTSWKTQGASWWDGIAESIDSN